MYLPKTQLNYACLALKRGGIIAHPTDTIYGLATLPDKPLAIKKLLALKKRPSNKGLILLANDINLVLPYLSKLTDNQIYQISNNSKPTTYLVVKSQCVPIFICGNFATVAVRISSHPIIDYLCSKVDSALVSTSANISGYSHAKSALKLRKYFGQKLNAIILPNRPACENQPSIIKHLIINKIYRC